MAKSNPAPRSSTPALSVVERIILFVRDTERSARWYSETLGLPVRHKESGWVELETRGVSLCLHSGPAAKAPTAQVGFRVDNFDAAYKALQLREVPGLGEPYSPAQGLRCAQFADPDGNALGIEGS